jgi:hypothetical protein
MNEDYLPQKTEIGTLSEFSTANGTTQRKDKKWKKNWQN